MEKAIKTEKKIECIIGIFFLIPPILGVLSFLSCLFGGDGSFARMSELDGQWDWHSIDAYGDYGAGAGCSSSPAPIYLGLMALAGAQLIKSSFRYFFVSEPKKEEEKPTQEIEQKEETPA